MPPSYFFHLKLELYPAPAASSSNRQRRRLTNDSDRNTATYSPPNDSDIFEADLPAHRTSKWSSYVFTTKRPATADTSSTSSEGSASPLRRPARQGVGASNEQVSETHGDALLLPERSLNRREQLPSPGLSAQTHSPGNRSNEQATEDWRYGSVSIESIDMEATAAGKSGGGAKSTVTGLHTKAVYLPSDPKTTEVGWGVVHLYRDAEESAVLEQDSSLRKSLDGGRPSAAMRLGANENKFDLDACTTLCILAVPTWMMPSDLLGFVGDQARDDVSHFRLIRTGRANKYMVLMKFRSAKKAREWQKTNNGRLFGAAEPENCHVVFIKSVEFLTPHDSNAEGKDGQTFPHNNANDPFTRVVSTRKAVNGATGKNLSSKPQAPPPPNLLELPTCPVCLERMDETTGLLTILCQHVFHCACLEKWRGSGCPVCRYTHSPSYTFPYPRPDGTVDGDDAEPLCSVCTSTSNLWVCLICGNIGCGRYDSAHAYAHYEGTSHCYAMDISTQRVWDYAGDGWVHRLIQSKPSDSSERHAGPPPSGMSRQRHENEAFRSEGGDMVPREKMESMANEYTYLLTSQLEGQRRYFEEQVERAVDKASQASLRAEQAAADAEAASQHIHASTSERDDLRSALGRAEQAFERSEKARAKFEQMSRALTTSLREEKTMNEGLLSRIKVAEAKMEEAKLEVEKERQEKAELADMNHDLTQFISGQEKVRELQAAGEEVEEGGIGVVEKPGTASGKRKGKGKKK